MEMKPKRIAYICDGLVPECSDKPGCHRFMKPGMAYCAHTFDPDHAANGACEDPENHPERFTRLDHFETEFEEYWEGDHDWSDVE